MKKVIIGHLQVNRPKFIYGGLLVLLEREKSSQDFYNQCHLSFRVDYCR